MTPQTSSSYRRYIAVASLILGPLLMSTGDLMHPTEHNDAAQQAAVIVEHASRWYAAHLLLFFGMLLLIPGILALADLTAERHPTAGYAARLLTLMGVAAFSAVFVAEMLIGRYASDGAGAAATTDLLETFQSVAVLGAVMVGGIAFFSGVGAFAVPLVTADRGLRWPAVAYILGALLILAEIVTAEVLLSQIGNLVLLAANAAFAWHILQRDRSVVAARTAEPMQLSG
jgi:hypothetical protein